MKCRFCQVTYSDFLQINEILSFKQLIKNNCCKDCYLELYLIQWGNEALCKYCRKTITSGSQVCADCSIWLNEVSNFQLDHTYLYEHNEKMSDFFKKYKFLGDIRLCDTFSKDISEHLKKYENQGFVIVPIPLSNNRLKKRGFNQVEAFLESSSISYERLIVKKGNKKSQSEKGRRERLKMKQPFIVDKKYQKKIKGKKILIVDDVYTTGRTMLHAYECLSVYHPVEICSFSLSR